MNILVWLLLCLIWGTTWIFIKIGLRDLPPIGFASVRFLLAAIILLVVIRVRKIPLPSGGREWRLIAITGILQFGLNYSAVFWGEQHITPGLAAVLQAMITVFGLVLSWFFLPNERVTKLKIMAVCLGILGVAVIFNEQLQINSTYAFYGCAAIVIGSYCAAQASILVKARAGGIHPAGMLWAQMLCGLPFIIAYSLAVEGSPLNYQWTATAVISVVYLTLFGTIAAFWLYYWLLSRIESTKAMMISLVTPLIAVVIDAIFLGEHLPPQTLLGGTLILASIGLIVFRRRNNIGPLISEATGN